MLHYQNLNIKENKVAIIGIGGSAANILQCFSDSSTNKVELITMDLDERIGKGASNLQFLQLGKTLTHGMGSGGDPSLGQQAAEESHQAIFDHLSDKQLIVLIVGLGGGTGSGAAPYIAQIARDMGVFLVTVALMPFSFEGKRRVKQAQDALDQLKQESNILFCFSNDSMEDISQKQTGARAVFEKVNQLLARAAATIPIIANSPGFINIGLSDLSQVLETRNSRSLFGIGTGSGVGRVDKAVSNAVKSPLMSYNSTNEYIQRILVHIVGDESLTISEIKEACELVRASFPDRELEIFLGVSTRANLQDELRISLIAAIDNDTLIQSRKAQIIAAMEADQALIEELQAQKTSDQEAADSALNELACNAEAENENDFLDARLIESAELGGEDHLDYIIYSDEPMIDSEEPENYSPYEQIEDDEQFIEDSNQRSVIPESSTTELNQHAFKTATRLAVVEAPYINTYDCSEQEEESRYAPPIERMDEPSTKPGANHASREINLPRAIIRQQNLPNLTNGTSKPNKTGRANEIHASVKKEQFSTAFDLESELQYSDEDDLDIPPALRKY